jgi:type I restriction enzyme S subunit
VSNLPEIKVRKVTIGEVFKVSSGGTPSRKIDEYFTDGNIAWVKTGDLKGKFVTVATEFISQLGLDNSSAKVFPPKTVLLAMYGATIGACSILPFAAATNQACAAILPSDDCNEVFLYYYLLFIKPSLINKGVGGAQPNISAGLIKNLEIPLPPLAEQQKLASVLDAADSLRQKDQQLIKKYTALSQSLFLEMFGDPVTNSMGWDVKLLKNLSIKISSGNTPKGGSKVYVDEGISFYRSQNVWRNKIVLDDIAYIDKKTHEEMKKTSLKNRDILMTKTGRFNTENSSLGRAALFIGEDDSANVNGHVYLIRL